MERLIGSPFSSESILTTLSLVDLREFAKKIGVPSTGNKPQLIESIVGHFAEDTVEPSDLTAKDLPSSTTSSAAKTCAPTRLTPFPSS